MIIADLGRNGAAHAVDLAGVMPSSGRRLPVSATDRRRRGLAGALAASTALVTLFAAPAFAGPQGGTVVSGSATISTSGVVTNINQSSNKAIINWQSFSVAPAETVNFNQPSASSVTLNRVTGNETSIIAGAINANGQVFLVNSNGILFTGTSQVNAGGLVASTLDIKNEDFLAGTYVFSGSSSAAIVNRGNITAKDGGYVSLMGKTVSNQGVITATLGTVSLNAGSKITLNFDGNSLVDVSIDQGVMNALVENRQLIKADGGKVIMTAKAADAVLSAQVNNSGTIQARTMAQLTGGSTTYKKGSVTLKATGGTAKVSGKLDASAPDGGDGGSIAVSGNRLALADGAVVTTAAASGLTGSLALGADEMVVTSGSLLDTLAALLDPSTSRLSAAQVETLLANNNVALASTAGDLAVTQAVSWSSNTTLALAAAGDVNINAPITVTGDRGGLGLNAGGDIHINNAVLFSGAHAKLTMDYGGDYYIRTKASYSGAVLNEDGIPVAQVDPHDPANGGDGVYGSITFTNSANKDGLVINGVTYTLIHSMAELDAIDRANSVTNLFMDGVTSLDATQIATISVASKDIPTASVGSRWFGYWDPVTSTTVPSSKTGGTCGAATCWYNPETRQYDLTSLYSGKIQFYYADASGKLTIPSYDATQAHPYYNPMTGAYDLDQPYPSWQKVYQDPETGEYTKYSFNGTKYYDPVTNTYHLDAEYPQYATMYYNPKTGKYDTYSISYDSNNQIQYWNPSTGAYEAQQPDRNTYFYFNPTTGLYDLTSPYAATGNYAIAQDLQAAGTEYASAPVNVLNGNLIGLGHTIDNLTITAERDAVGLVGKSSGVTIRDLGLTNVDIAAGSRGGSVGAFLGSGTGTLSNLYSTGTLAFTFGTAGGVVGSLNGTINSSYSDVDIGIVEGQRGGGSAGGLAGQVSNGAITHSHATGDIILTLINAGDSASNVGGLAGSAGNVIDYSYATGNVAVRYTDGVPGTSYQLQYVGGLLGSGGGERLSNSFATGDVSGARYLGGLVGSGGAAIVDNVYATGDVTALYGSELLRELYVGGLFGYVGNLPTDMVISNVFATGDVTALGGGKYVGGLIGYADGGDYRGTQYTRTLTNAYATGDVWVATTPGIYTDGVGGLIGGVQWFNISNTYATGNVYGYARVGGLVGFAGNSTIRDSYSTGTAEAFDAAYGAGGIAGYLSNTTSSNVYYNGDSNAQAVFGSYGSGTHEATALTGSDIADAAFYANGTIGQVRADRASAAAAAGVLQSTANSAMVAATTGAQQTAATPPSAAQASAGSAATSALAGPSVSSQVDTAGAPAPTTSLRELEELQRKRRAAQQARPVSAPRGGYGGAIRSIDVDGQHFDLEKDAAPSRSAPAAPAPATPAQPAAPAQ